MFNSYAKLPEGTVWETSNNVYIIGLWYVYHIWLNHNYRNILGIPTIIYNNNNNNSNIYMFMVIIPSPNSGEANHKDLVARLMACDLCRPIWTFWLRAMWYSSTPLASLGRCETRPGRLNAWKVCGKANAIKHPKSPEMGWLMLVDVGCINTINHPQTVGWLLGFPVALTCF